MGYGPPLLSSSRYQWLNAGLAGGGGGAVMTSGSGVYGPLATLGTANFDFDTIRLHGWGGGAAGAGIRCRISVTVNTGGGDEPLITDAFADLSNESNASTFNLFAPVFVPRGAVIKGKIYSASTSNVMGLVASGSQGDARMQRGFSQMISVTDFVGLDPANSVTASGTTATGWAAATAATQRRIAALYAFVDARGSTTPLGNQLVYQYDLGVGPSGSEQYLTSFLAITGNSTTGNAWSYPSFGPFPCDIPAGSRLVYRLTTNVANTAVSSLVLCGLAA